MAEVEPQSLRECYANAKQHRENLQDKPVSGSSMIQEDLGQTIAEFERCIQIASNVSLFSSNETLEDVATSDLQYFMLHFYLAELISQLVQGNRKENLQRSRANYEGFLGLVDSYQLLSAEDAKLYEQYQGDPDSFSTASKTDAATRRSSKIARFKEEKALKAKLKTLESRPDTIVNDDASLRGLHITQINLCVHQTLQSLESIAQELEILKMAPPEPTEDRQPLDTRTRYRVNGDEFDSIDTPATGPRGQGPILSREGRPLRPFTLLDKRRHLQEGVFRPGHSLPSMTIDEYLDEERRRGGIIGGGGPQSAAKAHVDEDNHRQADEETMKQRRWDDWKDDNPKGAGNTLNRG